MRRIDSRTVELTDVELEARSQFEEYLDDGADIAHAAYRALTRMRIHVFPSDEFIHYLSDDTCKRWGSRVIIRREWRE